MFSSGGAAVEASDAGLRVSRLSIAFGGVHAVRDLSFEMPAGEITSLIGPNGAGKTTVLNAVSGFVPWSGSIRWRGAELSGRPAYGRARLGIGRTFQNLQLFGGMTLIENLLVGQHSCVAGNLFADVARVPVVASERLAKQRSREVLHLLGLEKYADRRASDLPFGAQKLAGVARALAMAPKLLLLDEPAAGLSRGEAEGLGGLIVGLKEELGLSVLLVEHNMRLVMGISGRVVVLEDGRKLAEGRPAEIGSNPRVIEAYLGEVAETDVVEEVQEELARGS